MEEEALSIYINHWLIESNEKHRLNYRYRLANDLQKNIRFRFEFDDVFLKSTITVMENCKVYFELYRHIVDSYIEIFCGCDFHPNYDSRPFPHPWSLSLVEKDRYYLLGKRRCEARRFDQGEPVFQDHLMSSTKIRKVFERIFPYI